MLKLKSTPCRRKVPTVAPKRIFLIIDGYNLLHAAGLARRQYGPGGLQRSRFQLIRQLERFLSAEAAKNCTVVFDAFGAPSTDDEKTPTTPSLAGSPRIMFAPAGTDADTAIEKLLLSHSAPGQVLIVSGDRRLQRSAERRRAGWVDSEVFWTELTEETAQTRKSANNSGKPKDTATDHDSVAETIVSDSQETNEPPRPKSGLRLPDKFIPTVTDPVSDFLTIDVSRLVGEVQRETKKQN